VQRFARPPLKERVALEQHDPKSTRGAGNGSGQARRSCSGDSHIASALVGGRHAVFIGANLTASRANADVEFPRAIRGHLSGMPTYPAKWIPIRYVYRELSYILGGSLQDIAYPSGQHSPTLIRDTA